ncbi:hypothetical protein [Lentibacillus sediminis]|uniref:hypothetical protein n=1 Tax=Lentibacillus sediminis TaxID=1940529 RepID=UPI000C1BBAFF|nr:hypothetical protein [Lentibacillus sediminis]
MGWILIVAICVVSIIVTLAALPQYGDERKIHIKMKAQSYAFTAVIVMLIIEVAKNIYLTFWGNSSYEGISPFPFLAAISIVYLITLLIYKKRYSV